MINKLGCNIMFNKNIGNIDIIIIIIINLLIIIICY